MEVEQAVLAHGATARNCPLYMYTWLLQLFFNLYIFTDGHVQRPESETEFNLNLGDDEYTLNLGNGESTLNIIVEMNLL